MRYQDKSGASRETVRASGVGEGAQSTPTSPRGQPCSPIQATKLRWVLAPASARRNYPHSKSFRASWPAAVARTVRTAAQETPQPPTPRTALRNHIASIFLNSASAGGFQSSLQVTLWLRRAPRPRRPRAASRERGCGRAEHLFGQYRRASASAKLLVTGQHSVIVINIPAKSQARALRGSAPPFSATFSEKYNTFFTLRCRRSRYPCGTVADRTRK